VLARASFQNDPVLCEAAFKRAAKLKLITALSLNFFFMRDFCFVVACGKSHIDINMYLVLHYQLLKTKCTLHFN
jgi:hypothetical protein